MINDYKYFFCCELSDYTIITFITQLRQSARSDWLIQHLLFAHGCMLLTYSITKAKRALCD